MSRVRYEVLRFLVAGAVNTIVSYAVYLALLPFLSYILAYTICYVVGIALSYLLSVRFVFRVRSSIRRMLLFPLIYLLQYALGVVVLRIAVADFDVPPRFALLASIAVTIPVTFLLSRLLLRRPLPDAPTNPETRNG